MLLKTKQTKKTLTIEVTWYWYPIAVQFVWRKMFYATSFLKGFSKSQILQSTDI